MSDTKVEGVLNKFLMGKEDGSNAFDE